MKTFLLLFVSTLISGCSTSFCVNWEYASIDFIYSPTNVDPTQYYAVHKAKWTKDDAFIEWQGYLPIDSDISVFEVPLTSSTTDLKFKDYFQSKSSNPISILNALGREGWEVYDYSAASRYGNDWTEKWQMKRCKV